MGSAAAGNVRLSATDARLAFRVGVAGHRPNRLPRDAARLAQLRQTIHTILEQVRREGTSSSALPVILNAISPLAEGSDRIFAEEALALNYSLFCPMPFPQAEFEKDFLVPAALEKDSLTHFRALLERARKGPGLTVLELAGARAQAPEAYAAASQVLLDRIDLLIGVWDGGEPAGRGGTVDAIRDALNRNLPVIWIDAHAPEHWQLLSAMPRDTGMTARSPPGTLEDAIGGIVRTALASRQ